MKKGIDHLGLGPSLCRRLIRGARFEKRSQGKSEDALRARRGTSKPVRESLLIDPIKAANLTERLREASVSDKTIRTLASKSWMRSVRLRLFANLLAFARTFPRPHVTTFTVISKKHAYRPDQLMSVEPGKLLQALRTDLNRCGARKAIGALIAFIDGEFEPSRCLFSLHIHGLVIGDFVKVVDRLRKLRKYQPVKMEVPGTVPIRTAVSIRRKRINNLAKALTYLLKSYWSARWRGPVGPDGKFGLSSRKRRIPEPYHSLALLWLDQHSLKDMTLMMGMEAGPFGFRSTRQSRMRQR